MLVQIFSPFFLEHNLIPTARPLELTVHLLTLSSWGSCDRDSDRNKTLFSVCSVTCFQFHGFYGGGSDLAVPACVTCANLLTEQMVILIMIKLSNYFKGLITTRTSCKLFDCLTRKEKQRSGLVASYFLLEVRETHCRLE
jgi:hypothetical protein